MDAMMRRDEIAGRRPQLRARRTKIAFRESLRIRVPQVETPLIEDEEEPESPDSSGSSGDESNSDDESGSDSDGDDEEEEEEEDDEDDEEEDDDDVEGEEEEEEEDEDGAEADDEEDEEDSPPALTTMTHAPPTPTGSLPPSGGVAAPQLPPTEGLSTSIIPSETAAPDASDSVESIIASSTGVVATADAETNTEFTGDEVNSGSSSNRGADVGIIIGTLALAVLLVLGGVFLYRWRLNRKDQFSDTSSAGRPSSSGSDHVGLVAAQMAEQPGQHGLYGGALGIYNANPSVQNQPSPAYQGATNPDPRSLAMEALTGHPITPNLAPLQPVAAYQSPGRVTDDNGVSPVESISFFPSAGGAAIAPQQQQQQQQHDIPQVHITRASTAQGSNPLGLHYPPGSYRLSVAQTETTDATEGTWRTWGVDQSRPTQPQGKGWKERYLS